MTHPTDTARDFIAARGDLVLDQPTAGDLPDLVIRTTGDVLAFVAVNPDVVDVTELRSKAVRWIAEHMDELLWLPDGREEARTWIAQHGTGVGLLRIDTAAVSDGAVTDYQPGVG